MLLLLILFIGCSLVLLEPLYNIHYINKHNEQQAIRLANNKLAQEALNTLTNK